MSSPDPFPVETPAERAAQAELLRDIFGNPFGPVTFDALWRTPTVMDLARTMYEERSFEGMPVLADALEEAGVTDERVLEHCRGGGTHTRGCWILDAIQGRFASGDPFFGPGGD